METMVMVMGSKPISIFPSYKSKVWWFCLIMAIVFALVFVSAAVYAFGIGGYVSEKLIDRSGVNNSNVLIGRSGVSDSALSTGMSGIVAAAGATNIYMDGAVTHATLHGNLQNLNGFPSVSVYFQWGYDTSYGYTTVAQSMAAIGAFTADIQNFALDRVIYWRTVVDADGRNYSGSSIFTSPSGIMTGIGLLNAVVVVAYIAMVLFAIIVIGSRSTVLALLLMAVAIYIGEAFVVGIQEALRNMF